MNAALIVILVVMAVASAIHIGAFISREREMRRLRREIRNAGNVRSTDRA